jgi:hypothetical protein
MLNGLVGLHDEVVDSLTWTAPGGTERHTERNGSVGTRALDCLLAVLR